MNLSHKEQAFYWNIAGWLVIGAIGLLIATAVVDSAGRKVDSHTGPVPATVEHLSDDTYIVERGDGMSPERLCGPGNDTHGGVDDVQDLPKLNATYIRCENDIHWNDHRAGSISFGHAIVKVALSPFFWMTLGGLFLISVFFSLRAAAQDDRRSKAYEKERAEQMRLAKIQDAKDDEVKRAELVRAYAREEIGDVDFENGLNRIYQRGRIVPPDPSEQADPFEEA